MDPLTTLPELVCDPSRIEFSEAEHSYTYEGKHVAGVTSILAEFGLVDTTWYREEHQRRGTFVHAACELDDENDLDEETIPEDKVGYLEASRKFKREHAVEIIRSELMGVNPTVQLGGRMDRVAIVGGRRSIVDYKTGRPAEAVHIQLAAYASFFQQPLLFRRIAVWLRPNGTYEVFEKPIQTYPYYWGMMAGLAAAHHFKREHLKGNHEPHSRDGSIAA